MKKQAQKFNLWRELQHRAETDTLNARELDFFLWYCDNAEKLDRVSSINNAQFNIGVLTEGAISPLVRQNAQGRGLPSPGDVGIEYTDKNGKHHRGACEIKAPSVKSCAEDARNGTLAPFTLLVLFGRHGWETRLGRSSDVVIGYKGGKRVIKYADNLNFGERVNIKKIKFFAL